MATIDSLVYNPFQNDSNEWCETCHDRYAICAPLISVCYQDSLAAFFIAFYAWSCRYPLQVFEKGLINGYLLVKFGSSPCLLERFTNFNKDHITQSNTSKIPACSSAPPLCQIGSFSTQLHGYAMQFLGADISAPSHQS